MIPNAENALIVCGPPRSGTRFVTNVLNLHPRIVVQGEIPPTLTEKTLQFLNECNDHVLEEIQPNADWCQEAWQNKKKYMLFAAWICMQKGNVKPTNNDITFFGQKNPYDEYYWEEYNKFLHPEKPFYVYCIRNFRDHYMSMNGRWNTSISTVADWYMRSIAHYRKMKAVLEDNVTYFVLDDLISAGDKGGHDYLRDHLFGPLGIELDEQKLRRIKIGHKANSSFGKTGTQRRSDLTEEEQRFIRTRPELLDGLALVRNLAVPLPRSGYLGWRRFRPSWRIPLIR